MWSGSSRQGKKKEKQFFSVLNKLFRVRVPCQRRGNQRRWRSSSSSVSRRGSTGCGMAGRYGASKTKAGQETLAETLANPPLSLSPGDCHCACFFLLHARDQQGMLLEQCVFLFLYVRAMAHNRHLPSPLSRRCRVANRLSPCTGVVPNRDSADRHEASRRVRQGAKRQSHLRILQSL